MTAGVVVEVREPGRVPLRIIVSDRLPIGRDGDGLLLADSALSRQHCEIRLAPDGLVLRDLGSSNGTTCNGKPVKDDVALEAGDLICIGQTEVVVDPDASVDLDVLPESRPGDRPAAAPAQLAGATRILDLDAIDLRGSIGLIAAEVMARSDELRESVVGGTVTLVFSEIVDCLALSRRYGDEWPAVLAVYNDTVRSQLVRYRGTLVRSTGDGHLMTFPSVRHGLLLAIAVQRQLVPRQGADFPVHVRMGVHTGEAAGSGDLFGGHVNYAARVSGQAGDDEIVASSVTRQLAAPMSVVHFGDPREATLKGFPGVQTVHPVQWR